MICLTLGPGGGLHVHFVISTSREHVSVAAHHSRRPPIILHNALRAYDFCMFPARLELWLWPMAEATELSHLKNIATVLIESTAKTA